MTTRRARTLFILGMISISLNGVLYADLAGEIPKLPARSFCINAGFDAAWQSTLSALGETGIQTTLQDPSRGVITTAFAQADASRLRKIANRAQLFSKGRFTMKIRLEKVTPAYTKLHVTLQVRQKRRVSKQEKLLRSKGVFEKFLASRINTLAIQKQFPKLYELRLGFDLVPNLKTERFQIKNVQNFSPAGEAGFQNADWLLAVNGTQISLNGELFDILLSGGKEKVLNFLVQRGAGQQLEIPLWVIQVKETGPPLGMRLVWDAYRQEFSVAGVEPNSRAQAAGFQVNDILLSEGGLPLNNWTNYYRAIERETSDRTRTEFRVRRGSQLLSIFL